MTYRVYLLGAACVSYCVERLIIYFENGELSLGKKNEKNDL